MHRTSNSGRCVISSDLFRLYGRHHSTRRSMWTLMGYGVLYPRANMTSKQLTTKNHCGMPIPFPSCGLLNPFPMTNSTFILLYQLTWAAVSASYVSLRQLRISDDGPDLHVTPIVHLTFTSTCYPSLSLSPPPCRLNSVSISPTR